MPSLFAALCIGICDSPSVYLVKPGDHGTNMSDTNARFFLENLVYSYIFIPILFQPLEAEIADLCTW